MGEQDVCELALTVRCPWYITLVTVQVIKIYLGILMKRTADNHNPAGAAPRQSIEQEVGKQEVAQVIDSKMHLVAILALPVRAAVHTGIIDQNVQPVFRPQEIVDKSPYGAEGREVKKAYADFSVSNLLSDFLSSSVASCNTAASQDDLSTSPGQRQSCCLSNTRVTTSNNGRLSFQT